MTELRELPHRIVLTERRCRQKLRRRLAEKGFYIFGLSKRWRQTRADFAAIDKEKEVACFLVHAGRGITYIRPFNWRHAAVVLTIDELALEGFSIEWLPQVPLRERTLAPEDILSQRGRREYLGLFKK